MPLTKAVRTRLKRDGSRTGIHQQKHVCVPNRRCGSNTAARSHNQKGDDGKEAYLGIGDATVVPGLGVGLVLAVAVAASWTATHFSGLSRHGRISNIIVR